MDKQFRTMTTSIGALIGGVFNMSRDKSSDWTKSALIGGVVGGLVGYIAASILDPMLNKGSKENYITPMGTPIEGIKQTK